MSGDEPDNNSGEQQKGRKVIATTKTEYESSIKVTNEYDDGSKTEHTFQKQTRYKSAASHARWDDNVTTTNAELGNKKNQGNNNNTMESQDTSD